MEPTYPPVPDDASPERLQDEENQRYPEHGDPDEARKRVGLDRREGGDSPDAGSSTQ
jgi:hypothetical protein